MTLRRYALVRTAWQVGVLFVFFSLAYVVAWVVPKESLGHDPGYGGFLRDLTRGSLGRSAGLQPGNVGPSVRSVVWDASWVTISFLLVTGVFAVSLGALFAFVTIRAPRVRPAVRGIGLVFVSLLPIWTGLYLAFYLGADWHVIRFGGYCPLRATPAYDCHGLRAWLSSLLLPAIALGIYFGAIYGRWLRRRSATGRPSTTARSRKDVTTRRRGAGYGGVTASRSRSSSRATSPSRSALEPSSRPSSVCPAWGTPSLSRPSGTPH
jgi:hypothetical protein